MPNIPSKRREKRTLHLTYRKRGYSAQLLMKKIDFLRTRATALKNYMTDLRNRQLSVTVNGQLVNFSEPQPVIINNVVYVPMRFVTETIGAQTDWVQETQTLTITRWHISIVLQIDSRQLLRHENGLQVSTKHMDAAPLISEGHIMLPIRSVMVELGCVVDWNIVTATLTIYDVQTKPMDVPETSLNETLLSTGLSSTSTLEREPNSVSTHGVVYQSSSANFEFYSSNSAKRYISYISIVLESAYRQLCGEFGVTLNERVAVRVYPSYRSFCEAIGKEFSSNVTHKQVFGKFQEGGDNDANGIYMTLPNSDILRDQENFYDKILLHELIHILAEKITPTHKLQNLYLHWLIEGLADYKSGEIAREYAQAILKSGVAYKSIPSLRDLEIKDVDKFDAMGGYTYGASIIEFIDKKYGFKKVMELYKNPNEYKTVFGFSKDEFEKQWQQYLKENYG